MAHILDDMAKSPNADAHKRQHDHIRRAIAELMRTPHGMTLLQALNDGAISAQTLNTYILDIYANR